MYTQPSVKRGIFWFRSDLRLTDMPALSALCHEVSELVLLYFDDPRLKNETKYGVNRFGLFRQQFIDESLSDLQKQLEEKGQHVLRLRAEPETMLPEIARTHGITHIGVHTHQGLYERRELDAVRKALNDVIFIERDANTLFDESALPFAVSEMPAQFTAFRKEVEKSIVPNPPEDEVYSFPPMPVSFATTGASPANGVNSKMQFSGGERAGKARVREYFFNTQSVSTYKETRNALDDFNSSTKFSPWLANGCLSGRWIYQQLLQFETEYVKNSSTYWVYFELLWREFFAWSQRNYHWQWFHKAGIRGVSPSSSFSEQKLHQWQQGETGYPIVDACMRQLKETGYMSNRGRQLVASCLVHELAQNWQYGAAWFEHYLIDYDVGSNWGNWLYLAGVGHDPRGHRRFDLDKQTRMYDPEHEFIKRWL